MTTRRLTNIALQTLWILTFSILIGLLRGVIVVEGIERFGMGNWKAISEYISDPLGPYTKTTKQCEEHYWEDYMGRYDGVCSA